MITHLGWHMEWKDAGKHRYKTMPDRIECRKRFSPGQRDQADILIIAMYSDSTVSMNGTAHLTDFDLREMAEVLSVAQDMVHKGVRP